MSHFTQHRASRLFGDLEELGDLEERGFRGKRMYVACTLLPILASSQQWNVAKGAKGGST